MAEKLSVLITTHNEEENIAECVRSLGDLADEIVVLDNFSTDQTIGIAGSLGAKIQQREFENYTSNKNFGLSLLRNDWVFVIDADERVTEPLRREIHDLLQQPPQHAGYRIRRETFFHRTLVRCWSGGAVLRLFRRSKAHFREDKLVHEELVIEGSTGRLQASLQHYTFRSFPQYLSKMHSFADLAAKEAFQRGDRCSWPSLLLYPPARFAKTYFLRGGILDGVPGLLIAWLSAYATYLKLARLWELQNAEA